MERLSVFSASLRLGIWHGSEEALTDASPRLNILIGYQTLVLYCENLKFNGQQMETVAWIAIVLFLMGIGVFLMRKKTRPADVEIANELPETVAEVVPVTVPRALADRIVIGQTQAAPLITIENFPDLAAFQSAKPIDARSSMPISKLNALFQAAPALLVAGEAHGKKLMEVVINGDLVRAADGNGLRPYAMSDGKIVEQARLLEVENLSDMINAAAVWQIASVVVAQKHLADISQKLDELKNGVDNITKFLGSQRRARIESTYEYLRQAYVALEGGDLPLSVRNQLEACERDLLEIQRHLEMEYEQKIAKKVEHSEQFGTEELTKGIGEKIEALESLAADIAICTKTRVAAWHVLSLFPGDPNLKIARKQSIQKSISSFSSLGTKLTDSLFKEISEIKSFWNSESTLEERRGSLKSQCRVAAVTVQVGASQGTEQITKSEALLLRHDQPNRLLIQIENGQLIEARQAA